MLICTSERRLEETELLQPLMMQWMMDKNCTKKLSVAVEKKPVRNLCSNDYRFFFLNHTHSAQRVMKMKEEDKSRRFSFREAEVLGEGRSRADSGSATNLPPYLNGGASDSGASVQSTPEQPRRGSYIQPSSFVPSEPLPQRRGSYIGTAANPASAPASASAPVSVPASVPAPVQAAPEQPREPPRSGSFIQGQYGGGPSQLQVIELHPANAAGPRSYNNLTPANAPELRSTTPAAGGQTFQIEEIKPIVRAVPQKAIFTTMAALAAGHPSAQPANYARPEVLR